MKSLRFYAACIRYTHSNYCVQNGSVCMAFTRMIREKEKKTPKKKHLSQLVRELDIVFLKPWGGKKKIYIIHSFLQFCNPKVLTKLSLVKNTFSRDWCCLIARNNYKVRNDRNKELFFKWPKCSLDNIHTTFWSTTKILWFVFLHILYRFIHNIDSQMIIMTSLNIFLFLFYLEKKK